MDPVSDFATYKILHGPSRTLLSMLFSLLSVLHVGFASLHHGRFGSGPEHPTSKCGLTSHHGVGQLFSLNICAVCMWTVIDSPVIQICSNNIVPGVSS